MYANVYTAASGLKAGSRALEIASNNLANSRTPGFRPARAAFEEWLGAALSARDAAAGRSGLSARGVEARPFFSPQSVGPLRQTGSSLDLALEGPGWFRIQTPRGDRLTRAGNFTRGEGGALVTSDGFAVLGKSGKSITLPEGTLQVDGAGVVSVNGVRAGQLDLVAPAGGVAIPEGGTLWSAETGLRSLGAGEARVLQGYVEDSAVDVTGELVNMIATQRHFEMQQRVIDVTFNTVARRAIELAGTR